MTAYATHHDVAAGMGITLTENQIVVATTQLEFASAIIRRNVSNADKRIAAGTLDATLVKHVAVAMVARHLRNPSGYRQEAIEDYSRTRDSALSAGNVYLSDDELELLSPKGNAFSITPGRERATTDDYRRIARWRRRSGQRFP
jgi:hypothetical protein